MQVIGRHLPSARTQLSMPFDGLELWLKLRLKLKLEKEFEQQTKNDNKGAYYYTGYKHPPIGS